jgi:hypothetical protein
MIKIVVHEFTMGDVEDPDLYAAEPLWAWQQSDAGKWVMENAVVTPEWARAMDVHSYSLKYRVTALLTEQDATYYNLKWGNK